MSLAISTPGLEMYDETWLLCIFLMTLLSAYAGLRLASQIAAERGAEQRIWLFSASAIAGYGRVAVQLALVRLLDTSHHSGYDLRWMVLGYVAAFVGRYAVFKSITRGNLRLKRLLPVAVLESAMVMATQIMLFRANHAVYSLSILDTAVLSLVCFLTCVFGLTIASSLIDGRMATTRWYRSRWAYGAGVGVYFVLVRMAFKLLSQMYAGAMIYLSTPDALVEIHRTSVDVLIVFGPVLLGSALVAVFLQRRGRRWSRDLLLKEEQQRVDAALGEQRVTRLQNEALVEEIRERKKIEVELTEAAFHDSVTGLNNRAFLAKRLNEKLTRRGRTHTSALVYIDIDHFKAVNDMLGHTQGDLLLKALGKRLRNCLHDDDTLACVGGDEYVILLERLLTPDHGLRLAQHILSVMEQPIGLAGTTFDLSASIGLCVLETSYNTAEAVLRDADLAMYAAKRAGGAQVVLYQPSMLAEAMATLNAKTELTTAIARKEFVLFYQPLVHLNDGSPYGVEALIRWNHPDKGLVSPGLFIPLAEQTGHIVDIGSWVLRQACTEYERLSAAASKHLLMTLNVSTRQLELPSFMDELKTVLRETKIPPRKLQLEITESILLSDPTRIGTLFEEIRRLGVKIAFDDFGTGYSSISYLQRYPVDTLKIDQSFVRALKNGPVSLDIVRLILQLAQVTGMGVCAEGIESNEEAAKLISIGCTIAQGYLFSRPMAMDKCLEYLAQWTEQLLETGT